MCRPLRGLENHFLPEPEVACYALTPGYYLSRLRCEITCGISINKLECPTRSLPRAIL